MTAGDAFAMRAARKSAEEHDRISDRIAGRHARHAHRHLVLSAKEKKMLHVDEQRAIDRARARAIQIILILFGILAVIAVAAQLIYTANVLENEDLGTPTTDNANL
jgi:ABC-type nickel/cobalt efflux system permease component RcnA